MRNYFIILMVLLATGINAQQKFALVIGNGAYTNFGALKNPVNDANDMAEALKNLGFTVDKVINGNLSQMENATIRLKNRLIEAGNDSYGFFFYAGHGVQLDGANYLIPADANIPDRNFLRERTLSVQTMLDMLNDARNALNVVVLDACRDFPATWSRNANRGLSVISSPPADSIIMYATGAGKVASDGKGRNGLFTTHLLNNIKHDLDVNEVFRRTMNDVSRASNGEQRPALYTDFSEIAYLGRRPIATAAAKQTPTQILTPSLLNELIGNIDTAIINSHENLHGLYAFHNSLPANTFLRITNLSNNKTSDVSIIGIVSPSTAQELYITSEVAKNLGVDTIKRFSIKTELINGGN